MIRLDTPSHLSNQLRLVCLFSSVFFLTSGQELLHFRFITHISKRFNRITNPLSQIMISPGWHHLTSHWPIVMTCESIGHEIRNFFPCVRWHIFEGMLALQDFWIKEQTITSSNEWYNNYTRFLVALKNRVTVWKKKEKYRPSLPPLIIDKLKKLRRIRNKHYRERKRSCQNEETRVLLRVINREVRREIAIHKSSCWQSFLSATREKSDRPEKAFWSHLSRVYRS